MTPTYTKNDDGAEKDLSKTTRVPLEATIAIRPNTPMECPLFEDDGIEDMRHNVSFESTDGVAKTSNGRQKQTPPVPADEPPERPSPAEGDWDRESATDGGQVIRQGRCNTSITPGEDRERFVSSRITPSCFCLQFHQVECIPTFERSTKDTVIVSVQLPDRETLRELIERLRSRDAHVSVREISQSQAGESSGSFRIDASEVTDKQLEALEVAVETGYYDSPRQADLEVLADRLDVSKSAVSQRLKAVESRLARKLVTQWSGQ